MKRLYVCLLSTLLGFQSAAAESLPRATAIPTSYASAASKLSLPLGSGLRADYYNGVNFEEKVFSRVDAEINFDWTGQSPAPGVNAEYFSVRWTGKLFIPLAGTYKIKARVDDGIRVWVGGIKLFEEWRQQEPSTYSQEIALQGNQYYDLKIEYYNDWKGAVIQLLWEPPRNENSVNDFFAEPSVTLIPHHNLFTTHELPFQQVVTRTPIEKPGAEVPLLKEKTSRRSRKAAVTSTQTVASGAQPEPERPEPETFEDLKTGEAVVLQNVYFEQSKYGLLEASFPELNKLANTLKKYPRFRIEIAGHTDDQGNARLNQALSENRAQVVATYLIHQGIASSRIEVKGYGSTRPVADNSIESDRTRNRRVEFVLR